MKALSSTARKSSRTGPGSQRARRVLMLVENVPAPRELEIGILDSPSPARRLVSAVWQRLPINATVLLSDLAHHYF